MNNDQGDRHGFKMSKKVCVLIPTYIFLENRDKSIVAVFSSSGSKMVCNVLAQQVESLWKLSLSVIRDLALAICVPCAR